MKRLTRLARSLPGWRAAVILWRTAQGAAESRLSLIAAGVAFYGLLAIFPAIAATVAIAGIVTDPAWVVDRFEDLSQFLPPEATAIIIGQAEAVASADQGGLTLAAVAGYAIAFYSASRGVRSLIQGLNAAYGIAETRGYIRLYATTFIFTVAMILGFLVAGAVSVAIPAAVAFVGIGAGHEPLIAAASALTLLILASLGVATLYRFGPARRGAKWRWITPGSAFAVACWVAGSVGFAWYVARFANYNETFGALGGVVVLLMWLWLSAYVLLLGARLDAEIEADHARRTAARELAAISADRA